MNDKTNLDRRGEPTMRDSDNVELNGADAPAAGRNVHRLDVANRSSWSSYSVGHLEEDLKALQSKWHTVEQHISERDAHIASLVDEICGLQEQCTSFQAERDALTSDLASANAEIAHWKARGDDFDRSAVSLEERNIELRGRVQELEDYIDGRNVASEAMSRRLEEYEDAIEGMSGTLKSHDELVAANEGEKAALALKVMQLERELAELKGRYSERESNRAALQEALKDRSREPGADGTEIQRLRQECDALKIELEEMTSRASKHEARSAELHACLREARSEQREIEQELDAQRELVQVLESEISDRQEGPESLDRSASRLSEIGNGIRELDVKIDGRWFGQEAAPPDDRLRDPDELPDEGRGGHLIVHDESAGEAIRYALQHGETTIGRSRASNIRLMSQYISRIHALITVEGSTAIIRDAGSANGFLVNDVPATRHELVHGDRLQIGDIDVRYANYSIGRPH